MKVRSFGWVELLVVVAISAMLLFLLGATFPLHGLFLLAFGWFGYLVEVLGQLTVNWQGVGLAAICLAIFFGGLHSTLRWLRRNNPPNAAGLNRPWPIAATARVVAAIFFAFVAGISLVGVAHQIGWLATSPEPLTQSGSRIAQRMQSSHNLRQIATAAASYEAEMDSLPPGTLVDDKGRAYHGWATFLLPYLDQKALHDQVQWHEPWTSANNRTVFQTPLAFFQYPPRALPPSEDMTKRIYPESHYAGNQHVWGGGPPPARQDFKDGIANTILAGEVRSRFQAWGSAVNWRDPALGVNRDATGFGSPWKGGAHFVFADGHTRFLSDNTDPKVLRALATPDGLEPIPQTDQPPGR